MIDLLAKSHDKWLEMAYVICRNNDHANEIVQEMYLKLHALNKQVNEAYIYFTLKSIYYNLIKKSKKETNIDNLLSCTSIDEEADVTKETQLNYLSREVNKLDFFEKNILELTLIDSQTELSKNTGIPLRTIQRTVSKIKNKIKNSYKHVEE